MAATAVLSAHVVRAADDSVDLYTPLTPPISFYWTTPYDNVRTIPSCRPLSVTILRNPSINVPATPPFTFIAAPIGGNPITMQTNSTFNETFTWPVSFIANVQFVFAMYDAEGGSGGSVGVYVIGPGSNSCELAMEQPELFFTINPSGGAICDEYEVNIKGGSPPYRARIFAPDTGLYTNVTDIQTSTFKLSNIVPNGVSFFVSFTDANMRSSGLSNATLSGLGSPLCTPIQETGSSGLSDGALAGAVVGGLLGLAAICALLFWFYRRRRRRRQSELAHNEDLKLRGDYSPASGQPLVTPFIVPVGSLAASQRSKATDAPSPSSKASSVARYQTGTPNVYIHPHYQPDDDQQSDPSPTSPVSFYSYAYPATGPHPSSTMVTPSMSSYAQTQPSSSVSGTGGHQATGTTASVERLYAPDNPHSGLANPAEFAFR